MSDQNDNPFQKFGEMLEEMAHRKKLVEEISGEKVQTSFQLPRTWIVTYLFLNVAVLIYSGHYSGTRGARYGGSYSSDFIEYFSYGLIWSIPVGIAMYFLGVLQLQWLKLNKKGSLEDLQKQSLQKAYGAKDWATNDQIKAALGNANEGLHVGSNFFWNGQGHMMTVGGSRGGKGVNLILPALLADNLGKESAPSFVVLDPKGENLAVSGSYLQKSGYNLLAVNPFDLPEIILFGNARFNPFDLFSADDPDFDKYSDMIAYALIPPANHANDYFDKSARNYVTLYIRHMMTQDEEPKNFRTLYKWLRLAGSERTSLLLQMSKNNAFDGDIKDEATAIFSQLVNDGGRTVEGIYSTVRTATDVFKDGQLRNSVSASDIDLKSIASQKTAIFVCLSPADLERCQIWLRLFFGSVMRALTKYYSRDRRVIMIMDEFPTLGALKEFETASGFLAGYNVTLWPIMQDLTQLKSLYANSWETFVNNAIVRHYLAIGDNFTADYISRRMPKKVSMVSSVKSKPDDQALREVVKPLLEPSEVMSWPNLILEIKGLDSPGSLPRIPYWDLNSNASPNPFRS